MVDIVVGNVDYPDVRDLDQSSAEAALTAVFLAFEYATGEYSDTVALGSVKAQSPDPDTNATVDPTTTTVTLTLSLGVFVPTAGLGSGLIQMTKRRRNRNRRKFRKVIRQ